MAILDGITTSTGGALLLLLFLIILFFIIISCKPWRYISRNFRSGTIKVTSSSYGQEDVERPLVSEDSDVVESDVIEPPSNCASESSYIQTDGHLSSPRTHGRVHKHRLPPTHPQLSHGDSLILDISDHSESVVVGQTLLKRPSVTNDSAGEQKFDKKDDSSYKSRIRSDNDSSRQFISISAANKRSILNLEVISGPSCGAHYSLQSTDKSKLPLTLGRVSPSDVLIVDSEVSGKHARINWNLDKLKWELVDMGSLNGTLLNSKAVNHPQTGSRHWGDPVELNSGDIIAFGTTSKISY